MQTKISGHAEKKKMASLYHVCGGYFHGSDASIYVVPTTCLIKNKDGAIYYLYKNFVLFLMRGL
jgi:hypothetical protein